MYVCMYVCVRQRLERMGSLDKSQLAQHPYRHEPVAVLASLHSSHPNASMKQYECGHTQPLLCMRQQSTGNQRPKPKGFRQKLLIIMIYTKHKLYYTFYNNHPYLKKVRKYWCRQNIGVHKISTKYMRQPNYWRL